MWNKLATLISRVASPPKAMSGAPIAPNSDNQAATCELPSDDAIRLLAYKKWEAAGKPEGDGLRFWLEAKQEASKSRRPKPR
jgi:hypothetical protein